MDSSLDNSFTFLASTTNNSSPSPDYEVVEFPPKPLPPSASTSGDMIPLKTVVSARRMDDDPQLISFRTTPLDRKSFGEMFDVEGRLISEHEFRQAVFRGGIDSAIRRDAWCFLFGLYPCHSTAKERNVIFAQRQCQYIALKHRWQSVLRKHFPRFDLSVPSNFLMDDQPMFSVDTAEEQSVPDTQCIGEPRDSVTYMESQIFANRIECNHHTLTESLRYISKDVPRTDRTHPYFAGDGNPHLLSLRDALMAFCLLHPKVGYVQGMNDILARFLVVFDSEPIAFWCFSYYIVTVQKDFLAEGMLERIESLTNLIEHVDPDLHHYLHVCGVSEMIFCHKWLLLSFQREFSFESAVRLLEILSSYFLELHSTEGLHARQECRWHLERRGVHMADVEPVESFGFSLFVAAAILTLHRERIFLCADGSQVHQFVASLSEQLDLNEVLLQAERLFYLFCEKSLLDTFVLM